MKHQAEGSVHQQHTGTGDNVGKDKITNNYFYSFFSKEPQEDSIPPQLRKTLLRRFRNDLTRRREYFFPAGSHPLNLEKTLSPKDVAHPPSTDEILFEILQEKDGAEVQAIINRSIVDIFIQPDVERRIAILGEPGSGKTYCLLEIFDYLLQEAEKNSHVELPIIFECSECNGKDILSWMAHWINVKYDIREERAWRFIQNKMIIALFDGLDELSQPMQENFVHEFNTVHFDRPAVLCCRLTEYRRLRQKLELSNAAILKDISPENLKNYLKRNNLYELWRLLQIKTGGGVEHNAPEIDQKLLRLAQRPLFLRIMIDLGQRLIQHEHLHGQENWEQLLWRLHLELFLDQLPPKQYYDPRQKDLYKSQFSKDNSLHCLRFLAGHMTSERKVELKIEELQPSWLHHPWKFGAVLGLAVGLAFGCAFAVAKNLAFGINAGITFGLAYGFAGGISNSLSGGLSKSLVGGLTTGVAFGLIFGLTKGIAFGLAASFAVWTDKKLSQFNMIELVKVSRLPRSWQDWKELSAALAFSLSRGLAGGVAIGLIFGMTGGVAAGIAIGVAYGLSTGLAKLESPVAETVYPNQGILYTVRDSLLLVPVISMVSTLIFLKIINLQEKETLFSNMKILYLVFSGILIVIFFFLGTNTAFRHYLLRVLLWQERLLPLNLITWLEAMRQRKIMQRAGGSYRFIHRQLQEYLAQRAVD